jgi:hypothetical protein
MCPLNQPKKDPIHLYSVSPHLPQFQHSAGATLFSLSGSSLGQSIFQLWDPVEWLEHLAVNAIVI